MTKYVVIDWKKDKNSGSGLFPITEDDVIFYIDDGEDTEFFVCDCCFKKFKTRSLHHLENCNLAWPYEDYFLCRSAPNSERRIYRIEKEGNRTNDKIIKAICQLGNFSKDEQKIGLPISTKGLLGKTYRKSFSSSKFFYYVVFSYKKITAYCLV